MASNSSRSRLADQSDSPILHADRTCDSTTYPPTTTSLPTRFRPVAPNQIGSHNNAAASSQCCRGALANSFYPIDPVLDQKVLNGDMENANVRRVAIRNLTERAVALTVGKIVRGCAVQS